MRPCACAAALARALGFGPLNVPTTTSSTFVATALAARVKLAGSVEEDGAILMERHVGGQKMVVVRPPGSKDWGLVAVPGEGVRRAM